VVEEEINEDELLFDLVLIGDLFVVEVGSGDVKRNNYSLLIGDSQS